MSVERRYQRATCTAVVLGITSYATAAGSVPLALFAVPLVVGLWRVSSAAPGESPRFLLPRWAVNLLLAGTLLFAGYRTVTRGPSVEGVAELVVLLQLIKLGDRRGARDDAQILALSVFLSISAMLTSNTVWVGFQLVAFLPILILAVMLHQLHAGLERARRSAFAAGRHGQTEAAVAGRAFIGHLRYVAGLALACAMVMAVVVFVLMPRGIGENQFGRWGAATQRQLTGFTDQVQLGQGAIISESQEVVLDLQVRSAQGDNLGQPDSIHYLRGAVLDKYDRGLWVASARPPGLGRTVMAGETHNFPENPRTIGLVEQVVKFRTIGNQQGQPIFALWRPLRIGFVTRGRVKVDNPTRTGRIFPQERLAEGFEYHIVSALQPFPGEPTERTPDVPRVPGEGLAALASEILRNANLDPDPATRPVADDERAAQEIEGYLRRTFRYSLSEPASPSGVDPIEYFLFDTRQGHCEYFASAMTALCRAVGINARMVVGYVAAEYNDAAQVYTVRQSNAHAWVEAELGRDRWRRFDPTPTADLARLHRATPGIAGRIRQWIDAIEFLWNSRVVSFDERARERMIGRTADGSGGGILGGLDRFLQRIRAGGPRLIRDASLGAIGVFVVAAGLGALVVVLLRSAGRLSGSRYRKHARRTAIDLDPKRAAQVRFYARLLDLLAARGHPKPAWRPPLDHAEGVRSTDRTLGAATETLSRLYYRARFGDHPIADPERREAEALLDSISGPRGASAAA